MYSCSILGENKNVYKGYKRYQCYQCYQFIYENKLKGYQIYISRLRHYENRGNKMNNKGQFKPGNKAAAKPILCPHCHKEIQIRHYIYIDEKPLELKETTIKNGVKNV